jgi:hypothetical protein
MTSSAGADSENKRTIANCEAPANSRRLIAAI